MTARQAWRELLDADQARFAVRADRDATDKSRLKAELRAEIARIRFVEVLGGEAA